MIISLAKLAGVQYTLIMHNSEPRLPAAPRECLKTLPPPVDPDLEKYERTIKTENEWQARLAFLAKMVLG